MPTLQARMTPFMFYPWLLITVLVTALTWYVEANKGTLDEFSLSTDAHIVMGGGTPRPARELTRCGSLHRGRSRAWRTRLAPPPPPPWTRRGSARARPPLSCGRP